MILAIAISLFLLAPFIIKGIRLVFYRGLFRWFTKPKQRQQRPPPIHQYVPPVQQHNPGIVVLTKEQFDALMGRPLSVPVLPKSGPPPLPSFQKPLH